MPGSNGFVIEIEQGLLGAILSGGDHRGTLSQLEPEYFIEPVHAAIFDAARAAQASYGATDLPVVSRLIPAELRQQVRADAQLDLDQYLARMVSNTMFDTANAGNAVKAVKRQWARVSLGGECRALADAAANPSTDPAELVRNLVARTDEIASHLRAGTRARTRQTISEAAAEALEAAVEARNRKGLTGITTGLVDIDRATGGFQRRDLIIIAARPGMGKTTIGTSIARKAAASGVGVAFFSLEMDNAKLGARFVSDLAHEAGARIPYQDLIAGRIGEGMEQDARAALEQYRNLPFWTDDASGITVSELRAKTERMLEDAAQAGTPLGMVLVDHLGKIRPSARYAGNRANEVGETTDALKALAREYDLAVVLLSQLNRGVEGRDDKRPQLMDLRDSGNIEQDADAVMFLYREAYYLERAEPADFDARIEWLAKLERAARKAELSIAKQRNGPTNTIDLFVDIACSAVRNAARSPSHG